MSEVDLAVDRLLKARLLAARPDYGWLSEETRDAPERLARRRLWVVDPIDGTRDLIRGRGGWAVCAALVEDGRPVLGVIEAPVRGQRYVAVRGSGATLNRQPLRVLPPGPSLRIPADPQAVASPIWGEGWLAEAVEKPNSVALRLAKIADGSADAFLDARTTNEWDVAAASLLLAEAGAVVTDRAGRPLAFNRSQPTIDGLVAAGPELHPTLVSRLAQALERLATRGIRPGR